MIIAHQDLAGRGSTLGIRVETAVAFSSKDWSQDELEAFIYGVVMGWGDADEDDDVWGELTERFGWTSRDVTVIEEMHRLFKEKLA